MLEITVNELKRRLDKGDDLQLVDVRQPDEFAFAAIGGAELIPLGEIMERSGDFDEERDVVVFCRSGIRSARAIEYLESRGYKGRLFNLVGGIIAWSDEIDPAVPKY